MGWLPSGVVSVSALICEKILHEEDSALSAIRIVDVFYFRVAAELPIEKQAVLLHVLVHFAMDREDKAEHAVRLELVRPDGETTDLGQPYKGLFPSRIKEAPSGFTLDVQLGVIPRISGTHHVSIFFDGVLVTKAPFTLLERRPDTVG